MNNEVHWLQLPSILSTVVQFWSELVAEHKEHMSHKENWLHYLFSDGIKH